MMNPIKTSASTHTQALQHNKLTEPTGFISSLLPSLEVPTFAKSIDPFEAAKSMATLFLPSSMLRTAFQAYTAFSLITATNAASTEPQQTKEKEITNCAELFEIGKSSDFPKDGRYIFNNDIDCKNTQIVASAEIKNGQLDGKGHSISNLKNTLFKTVENSAIHNLTIKDSLLAYKHSTLSESISGNSEINNINFKNIKMQGSKPTVAAGILASSVRNGARIQNIHIDNSLLIVTTNQANTTLNVGLLAGSAEQNSELSNIKINNSLLSTAKLSQNGNNVGGCVGLMSDNSQADLLIIKGTTVVSRGKQSVTGGAVGRLKDWSCVRNTLVDNSNISSTGIKSHTGAVLGAVDSISIQNNLNAYNNTVASNGVSASTGGVIGKSNANAHAWHLFSVKNQITAAGASGNAGGIIGKNAGKVGVGLSVNNTAIQNGTQVNDPIAINKGATKQVSNEVNCTDANFAVSFFNEECKLKINDEALTSSTNAIPAKWGAGLIAGTTIGGIAAAATLGGICYLIREYIRSDKTDSTNKIGLFFKPITAMFNQAPVYRELEEFDFDENEGEDVIFSAV